MRGNRLKPLIKAVFSALFRLLARVSVEGKKNLPKDEGYILATNHLSILDAPLVYISLDRYDLTALVAKKHQKNPLLRWIINEIGGIWLNREEADSRALRSAQAHLKDGGVLGIAPEGTRSPNHSLLPAKTGVAYIADRTEASIVPAAIIGSERSIPKMLTLQRPRMTIRFGKPFKLPPLNRKTRYQDLKDNTDEIMSQIASLLPPSYQGFYANHPRVLELTTLTSKSNEQKSPLTN
ncbi:MAG: 1-acyl-sn-glycerol-3-phosphate acyltransferase [Anaerolineales bacterium]|nr:1-acyl-sn-glycerol-3-phosphate acyltransferase [Anaerolineales bacterium]